MNKNKNNVKAIKEEYGNLISIPIDLLINPYYNAAGGKNRLRHNSVILYGILQKLSNEISQKDETGNNYIAIGNKQLEILVGSTNSSVTNMLKQLVEYGLIKINKAGNTRRIYVNNDTIY